MNTKHNILVTGGSGFIGSNFIRYMLDVHKNYKILNFDKLTYAGNPDNLSDVSRHPNYGFMRGDIAHFESIGRAVKGMDTVVHFAAESHVDRSIKDSAIFVKTNVTGTLNLLEQARRQGVKKFIHVSTDEVYGTLGKTGHFTEQTPLAPNSPYSASKAGSDLLVRSYYETFRFPGIITRCSNNYGPYQYPEKLIPLMISNALADQPLPVYGDGLYVRDWLYVQDHCRAIDAVIDRGKAGEVYNIGGNNEWFNIDIVKLILKELNKPTTLIRNVTDRLGHDRRYAIDSSKMKRELGWEPLTSFKEGIKKTIDWYVQNEKWLARLKKREKRFKKVL